MVAKVEPTNNYKLEPTNFKSLKYMTWQINEIQRSALVEGMDRHMCSSSRNRLQMEKLSKQPLKYTCFEIFPSLNTNIDLLPLKFSLY